MNFYWLLVSFCLIPLATALGAGRRAAAAESNAVVHMLVPGFTVRELPIHLSNINNLRFGPDGRLYALGYDGRIHALRDTNGDGLEDKDELFWDKPTISVPVGMAWSKNGLYVSSHGKVSLLRDTDGDGKADTEDIIASGWPPTDVGSGGVDATAVTLDREGNVYFGLLVADYSNPYRLRKRKDLKPEEKAWLVAHGRPAEGDSEEEVSLYDLNGMRGTIQKWSAKTKRLGTIATGIRVPYTLAFNRSGDLFVTDQEGETWCPNGNPLDELNHIVPGRNYGFPPRHEKYLPNLISEPPVVAFGPQHQSSCGLVFNEPKRGQGLFGPKWWEGDAFVAGESRGKIWRVRLVKTPHDYIGKEYIIARLSMLTTDVTISPKGDLYVSCHSGLPDWGTGPQGEGKIFKISYADPDAPQPITAWAAGPQEVRIAFDKSLDPSVIDAVTKQEIEFGEYVRAGDRYEVLKPPYEAVKRQEAAPRGRLKINAAGLKDNGKTLLLTTETHPLAVKFALTIQGVKAKGGNGGGLPVDIDFDSSGVESDRVKKPQPLPQSTRQAASASSAGDFALTGSDWERGRELFFDVKLQCAKCHRFRGEGGEVGPDLSNLVSRDAASVLRDIKEPSASINPDYVAYNVVLNNSSELTGFIRARDNVSIKLIGADGKETQFRPTDVKEMRPSSISLMPTGLLDALKEESIHDLLKFLLNEPPKRTRSEINAALAPASSEPPINNRQLAIVLIANKQDHGPGQHDYPTWQKKWHGLLAQATGVTAADAWEWPTQEQFQSANVLVFYYWNHDWSAERYQQLDEYLARGGGVVLLHAATIADKEPEHLAERIGLAAQPGPTKYLHTPLDLKIVAPTNHAITHDLPPQIHFLDEPYWPMFGDTNKVEVLATTEQEGKSWPMMWTFQHGKGRVFASILGHYSWTLDDPLFRILTFRGIAWAAGESSARFQQSAIVGTSLD